METLGEVYFPYWSDDPLVVRRPHVREKTNAVFYISNDCYEGTTHWGKYVFDTLYSTVDTTLYKICIQRMLFAGITRRRSSTRTSSCTQEKCRAGRLQALSKVGEDGHQQITVPRWDRTV